MKNFIQVTRADGRELHLRTSDIWSVGDSQISGFTAISVKDRHWRVEQSVSEVLGKIAASERPSVLGPLPVTATEISPGGEVTVKEVLDAPRPEGCCGGCHTLRGMLSYWKNQNSTDTMLMQDMRVIIKILGV